MKTLRTKIVWLLISAFCAGCASRPPLALPKASPTMIEIYQRHALPTAEPQRRQPRERDAVDDPHTMTSPSTPGRTPIIHVYVFPHVSAKDGLSVPGYWTSFRLYDRHQTPTSSAIE